MGSSNFTPNLGIEQPATGMYANTWGVVANRSYAVIDAAIGSSARITLADSDFALTTGQGTDPSMGLFPLLIWNGSLGAQRTVTIGPNTEQRIYIMSNRTLGGFPLGFRQGTGTQFLLQNGYDAQLYADGAGTGANVAQAVANPQFGNVLVTGNLQVNGSILISSLNLTGWLGVGGVATVSDPVTITSVGTGGQLRLAQGGYGVIFRNDGSTFYLMVTNSGDPYGGWSTPYPLMVDLATKHVGVAGWGPDASYALNVPSMHASQVAVDGVLSSGGGLAVAARSYFTANEPYAIALSPPGVVPPTYIGTTGAGQFQVSNGGGGWILLIDQGGNANVAGNLTVNAAFNLGGQIQTGASGIRFADGTVMTTAATSSPPPPPAQINILKQGLLVGAATSLGFQFGTNVQLTVTDHGGGYITVQYDVPIISDLRIKENIRDLRGGLEVLRQLRPVEAECNGLGGYQKGKRVISVIAQELQQVLPECVSSYRRKLNPKDEEDTDILTIDTSGILFHMLLAIQQLDERWKARFAKDRMEKP